MIPGTLHVEETKESSDSRGHDAWEPDWIREKFVCFLRCSRPPCGEVVSTSGNTVTQEYHIPDQANPYACIDHGLTTRLHATYVSPAPPVFPLPKGTPAAVREELRKAFDLFWIDYGACANKLRSTLELLLDHFRIPRRTKTKKGLRLLDLHSRIERLRPRFPEVTDHLLAAKWIGNAGVHADPLKADDIFDAMELVEHALGETIGDGSSRLKKIAKDIASRKGPRSR